MKSTYIKQFVIISAFLVNYILADCGSCAADLKPKKNLTKNISSVNSLVTSVPKDGIIDGLVITSCGKCQRWTRARVCNLAVKIDNKTYSVKGTNVHDHGDAHSGEGLCSSVRVARAKGKMKDDVFNADSFVLIGD